MSAWVGSLRLSICFLASLLSVASFKIAGMSIPWYAITAIFFITGATMLQNNWRDRYHDIKKGRVLAAQHQKTFLALLLVFWLISCGLIFVAMAEGMNISIALAVIALAGLIYSEVRRVPLAPTLLVAFTFASPALLPVVVGVKENNLWLLFLLVALMAFGREIITDMADERIDNGYKWTIPLTVGSERAKIIAVAAVSMGLVIGAKISLMILPVSVFMIIGAITFIRSLTHKTCRFCIDISGAAVILILIALYS